MADCALSAGSHTPRTRGRKLQRRNRRILQQQPLCAACLAKGKVAAATEIDHIVPLHKGGTDDETNLAGLCAPCHRAKTAKDMGYRGRQEVGEDGWPLG